MSTPSDTPRTEAAILDEYDPVTAVAHTCRQLERELTAANYRIAKLESIGSGLLDYALTESDKDPCVMEWLQLVGRKST